MSKLVVVGLLLTVAALLLGGCGGDNNAVVFQNVLERSTWSPTGTRLAFTSLGGNGVRYVYSVNNRGSNLVLLTPTDNDEDLTDEGGKQPAWAPNGTDLAIVGRRGNWQSLFVIDAVQGAAARQRRLTDDAAVGADAQPSWKADGTQLVYVSNKGGTGRWEIYVINADGTGNTMIARDETTDAQWPVFSPDGTQIYYQSRIGDVGVDTSIRVLTVAGASPHATTAVAGTEGNNFRDEAPSIAPNGTRLAFHSKRSDDFDIWTVNVDGTGAANVTNDTRSDMFPVWSPDSSRIAFTRDRQLWSMLPDGTDQTQLTETYASQ